jgi:hypothetical protein
MSGATAGHCSQATDMSGATNEHRRQANKDKLWDNIKTEWRNFIIYSIQNTDPHLAASCKYY